MKYYDISVTITPDIVTWMDAERGLIQEWNARIESGSDYNASTVTIGSHCGTHLDAPLHFLQHGASVESLPLDALIGPCLVVDLGDLPGRDIRASDLDAALIPQGTDRLLLKTPNSHRGLMRARRFQNDFTAIAPDAASWLVGRGVRTVGIDYLSVGAVEGPEGVETHHIMLGAGLVLLEGLLLEDVPLGEYDLVALPLKIAGAEGCPIRAVLRAL